jgi:glycosyltransferase involved in cell wall biosynthesis
MLGQNTPMKIYSYLHAGKAILATRIRSHTQVLDDRCAHLVEPHARAIADGIDRLCADEALRASLAEGALAQAARNCSPESYRKRLLSAYQRAMLSPTMCLVAHALLLS